LKIYIVDPSRAFWSLVRYALVIGLVVGFVLAGFTTHNQLEAIQKKQTLYAVTRTSPTVFYLDQYGPSGFEYDLAQAFAEYLDVELKIRPEDDLQKLLKSVEVRRAHFAPAGLTITKERQTHLTFTQPYMEVTQQLIYLNEKPESLEALNGRRLVVTKGSSHEEWLRQERTKIPSLTWEAIDASSVELLAMVENGEADFSIVNSIEYEANAAFFNNLKVAFDLTDPVPIAWAFQKTTDLSLLQAANSFFTQIENDGTLQELKQRYFGTLTRVNFFDVRQFERHLTSRLPYYEKYFKAAGEREGLDWRLLAAIGYQESHWRSRAVSPTGVKGLMMLTLVTARDMGVTNRLSAKQSINGGAKFFRRIHGSIPEDIPEPDRTWMALAAYNVGPGHLEDARKITESNFADPDNWLDVMAHLPLLEKKEYYKFTQHGYARGREPVVYVQNIRRYYDLLRWHFPEEGENPEMPPELLQVPQQEIELPPTI
jgi:membrane-bound lytic murein transglycosylase F